MNQPVEAREATTDTVYLVQKYYREGMSKRDIAELLSRPEEQIKEILKIRLTPEKYAMMDEYRAGRQRR